MAVIINIALALEMEEEKRKMGGAEKMGVSHPGGSTSR